MPLTLNLGPCILSLIPLTTSAYGLKPPCLGAVTGRASCLFGWYRVLFFLPMVCIWPSCRLCAKGHTGMLTGMLLKLIPILLILRIVRWSLNSQWLHSLRVKVGKVSSGEQRV